MTLPILLLVALALAWSCRADAGSTTESAGKSTYVIVHGAWGGGWDWRLVDSLLTTRGDRVYRPSLTGLGERVHLASPAIGLATHIEDVVNLIRWDELRNVVLVGHSYGGMVITGVADRVPERIQRLIYVDAFLPESGETTLELLEAVGAAGFVRPNTRGGYVVPSWVAPDAPVPHDVPQPLRTFTDTLRLHTPEARSLPGLYILTVEAGKRTDPFDHFAGRAAARGWPVRRLTADHTPERSAPLELVRLMTGER